MPFTTTSGLQIFQFNNLSGIPWLGHGISTRVSGNLSTLVGDKKEAFRNRKTFFKTLGLQESDVVESKQLHGNHVAVVGEKDKSHVILDRDALITNTPRVVLFIKVADCVPILLVDPVNKVIGAVHAGWRGTVQEITRLAVQHMEDHFGTNPHDILAGIGPSIGPCCYEVDTTLINQFKYKFKYAEKLFSSKEKGHANLDLKLANKFQLIDIGVNEKNIEVSDICTFDNLIFFSERRDKPTGRFGALIWMK